jgi:hypothetical protein
MKKCIITSLLLQIAVMGCDAEISRQTRADERQRRIPVGTEPNSVEIADFNDDGKLDLVVANGGSNNVTILLGDGRGGFREANGSPFPAGHAPNDICVADFDGDRKLDLALANHESKYLTVLLGNGRGGFKPARGSPIRVSSLPHTHGVAAGDFNRDGKLDLVTESWGEDKVTVVFGDGRGGFAGPGVQFNVGKMPYQRLRVADVNGDGNADILTTNLEGDNLTVLLSDGQGGFDQAAGSPFPCGKTPFAVAIGDLNGDGKPDLAIGNWAGQPEKGKGEGLTVLLGDGKGGFAVMNGSLFPTGDGPSRVAIGDVNGDRIPEIVVSNSLSRSITVFGRGQGTFKETATIGVGNQPGGIAIGDLDGDGKGEIVVTNRGDNTISILFSK